jgi:twitching motility protein PilI
MARESNLKEFQEVLARRLREAALEQSDSRLAFESGARRYLVKLDDSGEVLPLPEITRVPLTRPWFLGIASVRGNLVSVVDWAAFGGQPPSSRTAESRLVLLAERFGARCGLVVAKMLGLKSVQGMQRIEASGEEQPWITACHRDGDGGEWWELDLAALCAAPAFLAAAL